MSSVNTYSVEVWIGERRIGILWMPRLPDVKNDHFEFEGRQYIISYDIWVIDNGLARLKIFLKERA